MRQKCLDDMAIIRNSTPFDSVKKKFSSTDEIHFKNRSADNATIGVRVKHPYSGGNSSKQQAARAALATAAAAAKTALADPEQRAQYEQEFKKQKKYMYLRPYVIAQLYVAPPKD